MAFELKANEPVGAGITRNVRNQIEKAIEVLGAQTEPLAKTGQNAERSPRARAPGKDPAGKVRRCFKRIRAALRMAREELGEDLYHEENWSFRDAARPLTQVRDARVLVETAERLGPELVKAIGAGSYSKIRAALIANRREVEHRVLDQGKAFATVADFAARALARLPDWKLQHDGWAAVEAGLRRVYRQGRRALAVAAQSPSVPNLHEWRKQAKYLWHELQLLQANWRAHRPPGAASDERETRRAWPRPASPLCASFSKDSGKEFVDRTHHLATLLGEDHDLAVLRETLAADPLVYGGHHLLKGAFLVIDRCRGELERQAFALGHEIYKDEPRTFTNRIEVLMHYQEAAA